MKKIIWKDGLPKNKGVYWFNIEFKSRTHNKLLSGIDHPAIVQIMDDGSGWYFNNYADGYLDYFYKPKICKAFYAEIEKPKKWIKLKDVLNKDITRSWVKVSNDVIGFALLKQWADTMNADIIWLNKPSCASECNTRIGSEDNYLFCPVENPILERGK